MLNREVWGFVAGIIWKRPNGEIDDSEYQERWTVSNERIVQYLPDGIRSALALSAEVIDGPSTLEVCAADLRDVWVRSGGRIWPEETRCHDESVQIELSIDENTDPTKVTQDFAEKLYFSVGIKLRNNAQDSNST